MVKLRKSVRAVGGQSGHERVLAAVKHSIAEGRYEGGMLPPYRQLVRELNVTMGSVSSAMRELEREGLIMREKGRGVFPCSQQSATTRKIGHSIQCINIVPYSFALIPAFIEADYLDGYTEATDDFDIRMRFIARNKLDSSFKRLCSPRFPPEAQGVVIVNSCPAELVNTLHRNNIPFVVQHFARYVKEGLEPHFGVYVNKPGGASQAVNHLLDMGHRRIGFMGIVDSLGDIKPGYPLHNMVFEGYRAALTCAGLDCREDLYVHCAAKDGWESFQAAKALLERKDRPTAILASGDKYALVLLEAARALNIRVPQDLSIIGFDNEPGSEESNPPLTTISIPRRELAKVAIDLLFEAASDPSLPPYTRILETHLIIRETTAPPSSIVSMY